MIEFLKVFWSKCTSALKLINFHLFFEIFMNIFVLAIIFKFLNVFEKSVLDRISTEDKKSQMIRIIPPIFRVIKLVVVFIAIAGFLQTHGYSVSSLIAGFGITGLAVGLAANATLSNVFGTIAIISDKSFKLGDYIKIKDFEGIVEDINMRSTKIRTLDNALTIIPNSEIANTEIVNISAAHRKRLFETIGVTYDTSDEKLQRAVKILEEILENMPEVGKDYIVNLNALADSAIEIRVHAYVKTKVFATFLKIKERFLLEVIKRFREENIEFAFPSRTVYLAKND